MYLILYNCTRNYPKESSLFNLTKYFSLSFSNLKISLYFKFLIFISKLSKNAQFYFSFSVLKFNLWGTMLLPAAFYFDEKRYVPSLQFSALCSITYIVHVMCWPSKENSLLPHYSFSPLVF
jgi:hypothetical protein